MLTTSTAVHGTVLNKISSQVKSCGCVCEWLTFTPGSLASLLRCSLLCNKSALPMPRVGGFTLLLPGLLSCWHIEFRHRNLFCENIQPPTSYRMIHRLNHCSARFCGCIHVCHENSVYPMTGQSSSQPHQLIRIIIKFVSCRQEYIK